MADLAYDDENTKESWLMWAIEFGRRGLWPEADTPEIEIHGPHPSPNNCYWGRAVCECPEFWGSKLTLYPEIVSQTRAIRNWRRHTDPLTGLGIRVWGDCGHYGEKLTLPIIATKDLPEILKKRIAKARKKLKQIKADRQRIEAWVKERQELMRQSRGMETRGSTGPREPRNSPPEFR